MVEAEPRLVWADVETTGIHARDSALLEIAAVVTDVQLNVLDEAGFHAVIYYPDAVAEQLREAADPVVQRMHDDTGLWAKLQRGTLLADVDTGFADYVQRFAPEPRQAYLAGNSIHLDRSFIEAYLPTVEDHLHYRSIDVSSIALLARWWVRPDMTYRKQYTHSARKDIRESIAELAFHRERWMLPPF